MRPSSSYLNRVMLNPWAWVQFAHYQMAALVTGSFVVAAVGAFYTLRGLHPIQAQAYLRAGTFTALIASLLLVLDNFEHLLLAATRVAALLAAAPALKVLVTSREPLNLRLEHRLPVGGWPCPTL